MTQDDGQRCENWTENKTFSHFGVLLLKSQSIGIDRHSRRPRSLIQASFYLEAHKLQQLKSQKTALL